MLLGVVSGNASMAIIDPPPTTAQVQAGKLRALAVTGAKRTRELPDVPTMAEAGVPGVVVGLWSGFFVPAGTPKPIIDKLANELREVILNTHVRDQLVGMAVNPAGNTPDEFRHLIAEEIKLWQAVVKEGEAEVLRVTGLLMAGAARRACRADARSRHPRAGRRPRTLRRA